MALLGSTLQEGSKVPSEPDREAASSIRLVIPLSAERLWKAVILIMQPLDRCKGTHRLERSRIKTLAAINAGAGPHEMELNNDLRMVGADEANPWTVLLDFGLNDFKVFRLT